MTDDYVYRFQYADESAFEIYADGRAFIVYKDGRREQKFGVIINRIPSLLGQVAKPRQDRIDLLTHALKEIAYYDDFLDAETAKNMLAIARDALAGIRPPVEGGGKP